MQLCMLVTGVRGCPWHKCVYESMCELAKCMGVGRGPGRVCMGRTCVTKFALSSACLPAVTGEAPLLLGGTGMGRGSRLPLPWQGSSGARALPPPPRPPSRARREGPQSRALPPPLSLPPSLGPSFPLQRRSRWEEISLEFPFHTSRLKLSFCVSPSCSLQLLLSSEMPGQGKGPRAAWRAGRRAWGRAWQGVRGWRGGAGGAGGGARLVPPPLFVYAKRRGLGAGVGQGEGAGPRAGGRGRGQWDPGAARRAVWAATGVGWLDRSEGGALEGVAARSPWGDSGKRGVRRISVTLRAKQGHSWSSWASPINYLQSRDLAGGRRG
jgi:hypothetical protein